MQKSFSEKNDPIYTNLDGGETSVAPKSDNLIFASWLMGNMLFQPSLKFFRSIQDL